MEEDSKPRKKRAKKVRGPSFKGSRKRHRKHHMPNRDELLERRAKKFPGQDYLMPPAEVAAFLGLGSGANSRDVRKYINEGYLPAVTLGGSPRVWRSDCEKFAELLPKTMSARKDKNPYLFPLWWLRELFPYLHNLCVELARHSEYWHELDIPPPPYAKHFREYFDDKEIATVLASFFSGFQDPRHPKKLAHNMTLRYHKWRKE